MKNPRLVLSRPLLDVRGASVVMARSRRERSSEPLPPPPALPDAAELQSLLHRIGADLQATVSGRLDQITDQTVWLAIAIAEQLLERELADAPARVGARLRRSLRRATETGCRVKVLVNSVDLQALAAELGTETLANELEWVADDELARGAFVLETAAGCWRYDPQQVLRELAAELEP
jgi:hypothetical protein